MRSRSGGGPPVGSVPGVSRTTATGAPHDECIFCRIVAGELPADEVARTDTLVAFHDIAPMARTHVLVVPTAHHRDIVELAAASPGTLAEMAELAGRVARELTDDGHFRYVFNTGSAAGQTVFHVHGHVLAGPGPAMEVM